MMKKIVAVLLSGCALGLCSSQPQQSSLTIHMKNSLFAPASAVVHVGDAVSFVNDDEFNHNVTSETLKSGDISEGKSWTYRFMQTGAYQFLCTYHPWMKGAITVTSAQ